MGSKRDVLITARRVGKLGNFETPHASPPNPQAACLGFCLARGCVLPDLIDFARPLSFALGGSQSLQASWSFRTTKRSSVFRRRHLYLTFSRKRNIRLVRST